MLIAATSSSSAPVLLNPALTLRPRIPEIGSLAALTSESSSGSSSAVAPSSDSSSNTTPSHSAPTSAAREHGGGRGGGDAAESAASTASTTSEVETLVDSYSITVGGTQYAGSVEEENGSFVALVPNVSGATATGSTMIEAENNLTLRIDELV